MNKPADIDVTNSHQACRTAQILIILVATMLHLIFLSQAKPLQSANDRSRWSTVWSLLERGTFQIDEIRQHPGWDTIDLVYVDQHFYSTKPPLLTCIVAGVTWSVQCVTGWKLLEQTQPVTFCVLVVVNVIPFVLSLWLWILILDRIASRDWTRMFMTLVCSLGTLLTPFLMTLNNHTVAAASVMIVIYTLLRILSQDEARPANWIYVACGFAVAWTVTNELPAAAFGLIVCGLVFRSSPKRTWLLFVPASAVPMIASLAANVAATGSWRPFYADYGTDRYRFVIDGIPSYWMHPHGVDQNLDSPLVYLMHCTIGHHGFVSLSPIVLLAVAGWVVSLRMRPSALRSLLWLGAVSSVVLLAFYMTRTQNYNYGGVSCALRWALWLTPLWLLAVVPVVDWMSRYRSLRWLAMLLAGASMFSAWEPIDNPWRQPWLFQYMGARGWIDYSDPAPEPLKSPWTWIATIPDVGVADEPVWVEFTIEAPGLAPRQVRLTAQVDPNHDPSRIEIEVRESWHDDVTPTRIRKLLIDIEKFKQGSTAAKFLRWSDPQVTPTRQQSDLAFVRGLPRKVPFTARIVRYLKTNLRTEALKCQFAAAHVSYAVEETKKPLIHRCDVWRSDVVPFGVAQVEFHISQPDNGAVVFHERWTLNDFAPK